MPSPISRRGQPGAEAGVGLCRLARIITGLDAPVDDRCSGSHHEQHRETGEIRAQRHRGRCWHIDTRGAPLSSVTVRVRTD